MGTIPSYPTFTSGEIPTAAKLTQIKTAGDFWALTPRCQVYATATFNVPTSGTYALMTGWAAETFDVVQSGDTPMHDLVTNPERIYIRTTGKYIITGQVTFTSNATGTRKVSVRANSAGSSSGGSSLFISTQGAINGDDTPVPLPPFMIPLTAGDYIEVFLRQTSGAALTTQPGGGTTFINVKLDAA